MEKIINIDGKDVKFKSTAGTLCKYRMQFKSDMIDDLMKAYIEEEDEYIDNDLSYRNASGKNGLVAAATQYASNAGLEILKAGGNAFDAAAAVGFALGVTEPNATGVGGQGTFLAFEAKTGEVKQFNFNAMIGKNQTVDLYDSDTHLDQMKRGPMSVAVPGTVVGLTTLVDDFGSGFSGSLVTSSFSF